MARNTQNPLKLVGLAFGASEFHLLFLLHHQDFEAFIAL
jgi:hypothetical protein